MDVDLLLRHGTVVDEWGVQPLDIAVRDGRIVALTAPGEDVYQAGELLDLRGLHVLPGGIDPHVHLGDQQQSDFEDFATGTASCAAGGLTTIIDMPLNMPPTVDAGSFADRRAAVGPRALIDFALWGGLIPGNLDQLAPMAALGAIAFKAFTVQATDWYHVEDSDLLDGMLEAARLGLPVGVHCENNAIVGALRERLRAQGRDDLAAHAESRPDVAEWEAIGRVCLLGRVAGARTHIVHISTGEGVDAVTATRRQGAATTAEVTIHHLILDEEDAVRIGSYAKCAPPLRSRRQVEALWERLLRGEIDNLGSDHSPATEAQKELSGQAHWDVPDGITGTQTMLPLLLSEGVHRRGLPLPRVAALTAANPARTFGLYPRKGTIRVGSDADFAIVDLAARWTLSAEMLHYKCPWSPFVGMEIAGRVERTIVRGQTACHRNEIRATPGSGRFLTASSSP